MSRIGKQPIAVPADVEVKIGGGAVTIKGKQGELSFTYHPSMQVEFDADKRVIVVSRPDDQRQNRALHGLTRSLINNMVTGVQNPFVRKLEIQGVGYNATLESGKIALQVGFANTVRLPIPQGVDVKLTDPTHIVVSSCDKQAAGQFAADVRAVRPPEPYKGKGIRYQDEFVRRKAGKAFGAK